MSSREEILMLYRQRIQAGERTKLNANELKALASWFVERLTGLDGEEAIRTVCKEEIALLEAGYPQATVGGNQLPLYRKAVRLAVADGSLPLTESTSRVVAYQKRTGEAGQEQQHYAMIYLRYDNATYAAIRGEGTAANNLRQDDLKPVILADFIARTQALLQSDEPRRLAVGIAAATGRRFGEVVERGQFEATDHPYLLRFEGQQKKHTPVGAFAVVTILPAAVVLDALDHFRALNSQREGNLKTFNVQVNRVVEAEFERTQIVPIVEGKQSVSIHRLRGVYGAVAVHYFCPPNQNPHRFLQAHLGHVLDEQRETPNSNSTTHYFHYRLIDRDGQPLDERGVLLAGVGALPQTEMEMEMETDDIEQAREEQVAAPTEITLPEPIAAATPARPRRRTVTVPGADLERLHRLVDQVGSTTGTHAGDLRTLLTWVEAHLDEGAVVERRHEQADAEPVASERPALIEPETADEQPGSGDRRPAEAAGAVQAVLEQAHALRWLTGRVEALEGQIGELNRERDHWRDTAEQATHQQPQAALLKDENRRLKAELQAVNQKLDTFRRLLTNGTPAEATGGQGGDGGAPTGAQPAAPATSARNTTPAPQATERATLSATATRAADTDRTPAADTNTDTKGTGQEHHQGRWDNDPQLAGQTLGSTQDEEPSTLPGTRGRKGGGAAARALRIFQAIQDWNTAPGREQRERWAVTPGLLEEGFGINRAAAKQFEQSHRSDIDQHHQAVGIANPKSHNRGKDVTELRAFADRREQSQEGKQA